MSKKLVMKRVDNPEGHQVCQVDQAHRTVAIRNKNYLTVVCFSESGACVIEHQRLKKTAKADNPLN